MISTIMLLLHFISRALVHHLYIESGPSCSFLPLPAAPLLPNLLPAGSLTWFHPPAAEDGAPPYDVWHASSGVESHCSGHKPAKGNRHNKTLYISCMHKPEMLEQNMYNCSILPMSCISFETFNNSYNDHILALMKNTFLFTTFDHSNVHNITLIFISQVLHISSTEVQLTHMAYIPLTFL